MSDRHTCNTRCVPPLHYDLAITSLEPPDSPEVFARAICVAAFNAGYLICNCKEVLDYDVKLIEERAKQPCLNANGGNSSFKLEQITRVYGMEYINMNEIVEGSSYEY